MRCYACTAHELWKSEAYFIPRPAQACNESAARILLRSHIEELKRLARRLQSNDYPEIFANFRFVRVDSAEELRADSNDLDRPDVEISDLVSDYFCTISAQDNPIRHLRDAFYSIACDETIARYLQWPIYEASAGIHDPFLPAFELWSKGVEFSFPGPGVCKYRLTSIDGA